MRNKWFYQNHPFTIPYTTAFNGVVLNRVASLRSIHFFEHDPGDSSAVLIGHEHLAVEGAEFFTFDNKGFPAGIHGGTVELDGRLVIKSSNIFLGRGKWAAETVVWTRLAGCPLKDPGIINWRASRQSLWLSPHQISPSGERVIPLCIRNPLANGVSFPSL